MQPRECRNYDSENLRLFLMVAVRAGRGTCLRPHSHQWGWVRISTPFQPSPQAASLSLCPFCEHTQPARAHPAFQGQSCPSRSSFLEKQGASDAAPPASHHPGHAPSPPSWTGKELLTQESNLLFCCYFSPTDPSIARALHAHAC